MSVNEKMTAIADAIRAKTDSTDTLTLDGMAAAIPAVFAAGESAEAAKVAGKHFIQTVFGSGTETLSFDLPFFPDTVVITAVNYLAVAAGQPIYFNLNFRSVSDYVGSMRALKADGKTNSFGNAKWSNVSTIYAYANGKFDVVFPSAFGVAFRTDCAYIVLAEKYETRTDNAIITDLIARLDDEESGSCALAQAKVNAAFTDEEWAALIAAKPNWTFTLA